MKITNKTIKQIRMNKKYFKNLNTLDFDLTLSYTIKKPKEFLYSHPEYVLTTIELLKLKFSLDKIKKGLPIAYVTKTKEFFGLDFNVNKNVLIPRPETETIVEEVLKEINCHPEQNKETKTILIDVGTGSGCIPISILKNTNKKIKTIAIDISKKALKVAKKNAKKHKVKIEFLNGNLLSPVISKNYDLKDKNLIITANLPYVTEKQYKQEKSIQFEPKIALTAKHEGLDLYEKLLTQLKILTITYNLKSTIYFEIDPNQTKKIKTLIKKYLPNTNILIIKDLRKKDRIVKINLQ